MGYYENAQTVLTGLQDLGKLTTEQSIGVGLTFALLAVADAIEATVAPEIPQVPYEQTTEGWSWDEPASSSTPKA